MLVPFLNEQKKPQRNITSKLSSQRSQNIKNFSLCTSHPNTKSPSSEYSGHHLTRIRSVGRLVIAPPIQDFGNVGEASSVIIIFITCPSCLVRGELPISNAAPLCVSAAAASSATVSNAHNIRTTDDSEIGCRRGAQQNEEARGGTCAQGSELWTKLSSLLLLLLYRPQTLDI